MAQNGLDAYVADMDENDLAKLLREYNRLATTSEKIRFVYHHFGPYYLWHYGCRIVKGEFVWIGFPPDEEFNPAGTENLANEIINFYVAETKGDHFNGLKEALARRAEKCQSVAEVKRLLQVEQSDLQEREARCKVSDDPAERAWFEGYQSEALKTWIDFWPATATTCYQAATGSAERLYELELQKQLSEIEEGEKVEQGVHRLESHYAKLLYFIYSGLMDKLNEQLKGNKSRISKAIAFITGADKPESIRNLLVYLAYGHKDPRNRDLFTLDNVEKAIQALKATKLDTTKLQEIYDDL